MDADTLNVNYLRSAFANALLDSHSLRSRGPAAMLFAGMPARIKEFQECPQCGYEIGSVAGSKEAVCRNCGYKDPCCE